MIFNITQLKFYTRILVSILIVYSTGATSTNAQTSFNMIASDKSGVSISTSQPADSQLSFAEKMYQRDLTSFDFSKKYTLTCSIFSFFRDGLFPKMHVYSTYRVDHCSPDRLHIITAASAKAQLQLVDDPTYVKISAPRVQLMDINASPMTKSFFSIGPLKFSQIAKARFKLHDVLSVIFGDDIFLQYKPIEIISDNHYQWHAGSTIYTLTGPDGATYIMTHAAIRDSVKSENELERTLENLSEHLNLPKGWTYRTYALRRDYSIFSDSKQFFGKKFLMDDGYNTYIESKNLPR